jgi:hypothetical protein
LYGVSGILRRRNRLTNTASEDASYADLGIAAVLCPDEVLTRLQYAAWRKQQVS